MFTIYYKRNTTEGEYTTSDLRTACIIGFNEVMYLGCEEAIVVSAETGEILRNYRKG